MGDEAVEGEEGVDGVDVGVGERSQHANDEDAEQ